MTAPLRDAGTLQDRYRHLKELGREASGVQYSGVLADGSAVTVHALSMELVAQIEHPDRFIAALERTSSVTHPSMTPLLSWGRTADGLFHCAYGTLDGSALEPGSASPSRVAEFGSQIARALSVVHQAGLVHGGIQTAAILHSERLGARLSNLGMVAALHEGGVGVREASLAVGDLSYTSPEQLEGVFPDARSDVFSLGAALYDLITGKPPFGGRTTSFVMASVLSESPTDSSLMTEDSNAVVEALLRAIERAPEDRWPTAEAFARALAAGTRRSIKASTRDAHRGWSRILAILTGKWFPTGRSRG